MALITVRPTAADVAIANFVATHTNLPTEETAGVLTWGADEHTLFGLAAAWWLSPGPDQIRKYSIRRFMLVSDYIGSGKRAWAYLEAAWRVASVRSWWSAR